MSRRVSDEVERPGRLVAECYYTSAPDLPRENRTRSLAGITPPGKAKLSRRPQTGNDSLNDVRIL